MNQTLITWLFSELTKIHLSSDKGNIDDAKNDVEYVLKTALMLEQEQLKQAWNDGYKKAHLDIVTNNFSTFEEYQKQ